MGVANAAGARLSGAGRRLGTWARPPSPANRPPGAGGDATPGPANLPPWRLPSWEGAQRLGIALCVLIAIPRRGLPTTTLLGEEREAPEARGQIRVSTPPLPKEARGQAVPSESTRFETQGHCFTFQVLRCWPPNGTLASLQPRPRGILGWPLHLPGPWFPQV